MSFYVAFLHGPAAAGKHTIGSRVAEALDIPLLHNHLTVDLVKSLFEFGSAPFVRLRETIWLASFREAAAAGRSFVFTFNPEATVDPALIGRLQTLVEAAGGRVHYVALTCPDDVIAERIGSASRARFGKLLDAGLYRRFKAEGGFDFPALPAPLLEVDTSQRTPEQSAQAIVAALERAGR